MLKLGGGLLEGSIRLPPVLIPHPFTSVEELRRSPLKKSSVGTTDKLIRNFFNDSSKLDDCYQYKLGFSNNFCSEWHKLLLLHAPCPLWELADPGYYKNSVLRKTDDQNPFLCYYISHITVTFCVHEIKSKFSRGFIFNIIWGQ